MEIGPTRNQNLIFWPLANVWRKLTRDNKKFKSSEPTDDQIQGIPANQFSPSIGTSLFMGNEKEKQTLGLSHFGE